MSPDVGCSLAQGARHLPWVLTGFPHRLLPLQCVKLAVYGRLQHCLRLRFPTGRKVYLQLCHSPGAQVLFLRWATLGIRTATPSGALHLLHTCTGAHAQWRGLLRECGIS